MASLPLSTSATPAPAAPERRDRPILIGAAGIVALIVAAVGRQAAARGIGLGIVHVSPWLVVHLLSVIPAVPLGAWVLVRRKGDRTHRLLGRVWVLLMMTAALSSFRLRGLTGHPSPIHLLSLLVIVGVPRSIWMAVRGDIARHRRGMTRVYTGLIVAGLFAFVPGRLFGTWLFGTGLFG